MYKNQQEIYFDKNTANELFELKLAQYDLERGIYIETKRKY